MKKKSFYLFLFLFTHIYYTYAQQISTDNSQQPNALIQNLIGDNCATISNVSSAVNGSINGIISYGSFDAGNSGFPLQNGFMLSTGDITSAGNSFIGEDLSNGNIDWGTDSDILDVLGMDQTLNATAIEFDFASVNSSISINYLFASEEYQQEYPCNFEDVFAILIKRAGTLDPYVNIAIVPETTTKISTSNIRPNINGFCDAQNEEYFAGYNLGTTNFNGHTTVLTANSEIIPGETYHIKFIIADHIDQRFDSAVFIETQGFGSTIDLGPDQSICGNNLTLDAETNNLAASYSWFLNGNEIVGENNPTLEINQSGSYNVQVLIPIGNSNCLLEDTIDVEIIPFLTAEPIADIFVCDPAPSDGIFDFNFSFLKDDEIFANLPSTNYNISYHLSEDDALNNIDPIIGVYQNTEQEENIFFRITSFDGSCLQIGNFNLSVTNSSDISTTNYTLDICVTSITDVGIQSIDQFDVVMSNSEINREVSYYMTEFDAINGVNPIYDFPDFNTQPPFVVARVEVSESTNECFSLAYLYFNYLTPQPLGLDKLILDYCIDPMYEEFEGTTLYTYDNLIVYFDIEGYFEYLEETVFPGSSVRTLQLYGLGNPRTLVLSLSPTATLRLGISYENANCYTEIELEVHKNLLYNVIGDNNEFYLCDEAPNDNIVQYDLEDIALDLADGYDISTKFYLTEEDRADEINAIDQSELFTVVNEQILFITSSHEDCVFDSEVTLKIHPTISITDFTFDYCGYTNPINNTTNILLEPLKEVILSDLNLFGTIEFYESFEDAQNRNNQIAGGDYDLSPNEDLFIRATQFFTECYDISTLQINITNIFDAQDPQPIIVCDQDQDLIATVNLQDTLDDLSNYSSDLTFTYYESFDNALESNTPIPNPTNFTTLSKEIFTRVDSELEDCFTIFSFDVLIYAQPQLSNQLSLINCEVNPNEPSDFIFEDKDNQIINNQEEMEVSYFLSEEDALNRLNAIDKTVAYQNISNPQTIYVRLQNQLENSCYTVEPMQIEVRQAPIYNIPTDIYECDVNNTGLATTNLNEKINEIIENSTTNLNVTFHLTPLNAQIGVNETPLVITTTSSPQTLYARIENTESGCFDIESFSVSTLALPEVQFGQSLIDCADNYNYSQEWNLTEIELDLLDGRQYNVDFTYFQSEEDLLNDNNRIQNPLVYTNTSNPQTIYAKIRNATTECFDMVPFQLIVNSPPQINDFESYNICENNENQVNLLEINEIILDDTFNVIIGYYENETDAENKENPLDSNYSYQNSIETLFARVEYSTTQCYAVYPFELIINPLPIANQPNNIVVCDDDFDGFVEIDLTQQNSTILENQNTSDLAILFFNSENNAIENIEPLNQNHVAYNNEIIFARLENTITGCFDITQFSIIINEIPSISIPDQVVCLDDLPLVVSAETNNPLDSYLWSTNVVTPQIEITEMGTYSVTVTNQFGCQYTSTFNVTESQSAIINALETVDFSDPNSITITIDLNGNYLFQLNDGNPQTSNVFNNVPIGYNSVTIIDQNGCAEVTRTVLVIDAPKHMSPNNDGDFDTWHIAGVETLPGTIVNIFDRKGKLLKQLKHDSLGWDGTYNGNNMPASDYWFIATIVQDGKTFEVTGHFALRR